MFPALFLSHGAPNLLLEDSPSREFLSGLGSRIGRPEAILIMSAHWNTRRPAFGVPSSSELIYDFYGFPETLYHQTYDAPTNPQLAETAQKALATAGFHADIDTHRGLDHGSWVTAYTALSRRRYSCGFYVSTIYPRATSSLGNGASFSIFASK